MITNAVFYWMALDDCRNANIFAFLTDYSLFGMAAEYEQSAFIAEQLNGHAAMMGFFIGVVTGAVTGKGIIEQLKIIFPPLV